MTPSRPTFPGQRGADQSVGWIEPASDQGVLPRILGALMSRSWVVALAIAVALAAAAGYLATAKSVYQAETDVLVTPVPNDTALPGFGLILDSSDPARATETIARLVSTPAVAERVKTELKLNGGLRELLRNVEAKPIAQSDLVAVTAKADDPAAAARLADAFGKALLDHRTARLHRALDTAIRVNDARLDRLAASETSQRERLLARRTDLRTLRDAPDPSLQVASNAEVPEEPVSPRPLLSIAGALLAGAILGVLGVLALEYIDPRLRREDQLSASYRLPILARVPRERARTSGPLRPETISPAAAHAYRILRANLPSAGPHRSDRRAFVGRPGLLDSGSQFSNAGGAAAHRREAVGEKGCVMVTSPLTGDGKTTTALNLAASLASPRERVILIEADTEHPSIGGVLGRPHADGLASVLSERAFLADALVPVELSTGTVHVLPAGPSGSRDCLSDPAAVALLEEASAVADWVVVDLPPLNSCPDALPLMRAAADLLIAVRLKHTNLRELGRLAELLVQQEVVPAGFVLLGTSPKAGLRHPAVVRLPSPELSASRTTTDGSTVGEAIPRAPEVSG